MPREQADHLRRGGLHAPVDGRRHGGYCGQVLCEQVDCQRHTKRNRQKSLEKSSSSLVNSASHLAKPFSAALILMFLTVRHDIHHTQVDGWWRDGLSADFTKRVPKKEDLSKHI